MRVHLVTAMVLALMTGPTPADVAEPEWKAPVPQDVAGVPTKDSTGGTRLDVKEPPRVTGTADVTWPIPATGLNGVAAVEARPQVPDGKVTVQIHDRAATEAAGVAGVLVSLAPAGSVKAGDKVEVSVDYGAFARAYGGDWASRLRLVRLPECALTKPDQPGCGAGEPVPSKNSAARRTVSGEVELAGGGSTVVAVAAEPAGDNGDYTATSLSPAAAWQVSQQSGAFSWSYPLRLPPGVGGPIPSLSLSYSSQTVDGRTGGTNTQGSWIGDGWDLWPGYVERSYKPCARDTGGSPNNKNVRTGDLCWWKPNATLSLNGRATELLEVAGGRWKGVSDDGSRTEAIDDHWRVTTIDGTQYYFGQSASSAWKAPVYGNHAGEPGHVPGDFAASRKDQVWRWNLDRVVDPHGNTMTLHYQKEQGAYGREGDPGKRTTYDRGGWLSRIEYGTRTDQPQAAAQVVFQEADRCASGATCYDAAGAPIGASWPDTPWDQYCREGTRCVNQLAPTFWTGKRLAEIKAQVRGGGQFRTVESWKLRHSYLNAGSTHLDGIPMWLDGITRTGSGVAGGTAVSDPEVILSPGAHPYPNRVDGPADGRTALNRFRVTSITTESGAQIGITYLPGDCTRESLPAPHDNGRRCMPQWYAPTGSQPTLDWFHKYVVSRVDVYDNTGGFTHEQTNYDYLDAPAWRYSDSELVEEDKRTWATWRGYGRVRVRTGLESDTQSAVEYRYFRGMDGDRQPSGVRDVWVSDSLSNDAHSRPLEDHDALAGSLREQTVFNGFQGEWVSGTLNEPAFRQTGSDVRGGPLKAYMVHTATGYGRTHLTPGDRTRWTKTVTRVNDDNLPIEVDDLADESTPSDDLCTRTTYLVNEAAWMRDKVGQSETLGAACAASGEVVSRTRTSYDDPSAPYGTAPTRGLPVRTEEWQGGASTWVTTATNAYDANGRVLRSADALGRATTTAYTPPAAGPVTSVKIVNPAGHARTAGMEPAWQQPRQVEDANGGRTDLTYDGLGRLKAVWLPGRDRALGANLKFTYQVRNNAPTAVTMHKLLPNGTNKYLTSVALLDGLLRERQTQTQAIGGGRLITDTVRDSRGLTSWTSAPYYHDATPPTTTLALPTAAIPSVTQTVHDGAGRPIEEVFKGNGTVRWKTVTTYGGDRVMVTPPTGGIKTETITDARGRKIELRQHSPAGFERTTYAYTHRGDLATMTDAAGNTWKYLYDQRGRKVRAEDPDRGVTESAYDDAGQVVTVKDARGSILATTYDELGRRTSLRDGSTTGPKRVEWLYDTSANGIGRLAKAIRHDGGSQYVTEVAGYDQTGNPLTTRITIPPAEGALAGTYAFDTTYKQDGQVATTSTPAAGGLPAETLEFGYNAVGSLGYLRSQAHTYLNEVVYNQRGEVIQRIVGQGDRRVWQTTTIDEPTGRTTAYSVVPELKQEVLDFGYRHDPAGNVTRISDTPNGGQPADHQCYAHDHLRRLVQAWSPASGDCSAAPSVADLGGPAPYWHAYSYTSTGGRDTETWYGATTTKRVYAHPAPGGGAGSKPHATTRIDRTGGADTFAYDAAGNMTRRTVNGVVTDMTWDSEGRLAGSGQTTHVYDVDGARLIRRDPGGTTLYLPNGLELRRAGTTVSGTRYYSHANSTIAVRTAAGLTWSIQDHHNTTEALIKSADLSPARRRTLPFGGIRGTGPGWWAGDRGFVNGVNDPSGLTHIGAREYDPALGAFISPDPLIDPADPQQWNAYTYANANPVTYSDPTGLLRPRDEDGGPGPAVAAGAVAGAASADKAAKRAGRSSGCTGTPDRCADRAGLNGSLSAGISGGGAAGGRPRPCTGTPDRCADQAGLNTPPASGSGANPEDGPSGSSKGPNQAHYCLKHPANCGALYDAADLAKTLTERQMVHDKERGVTVRPGVYNALRHALWMAMAVYFGLTAEEALDFGNAHELDGDQAGNLYGSRESNIDLTNNRVGAQVGADTVARIGHRDPFSSDPSGVQHIYSTIVHMLNTGACNSAGCLDTSSDQP
ncbi:RHS repeat-associated core domain-containing protein [Nonomuraea sp. NPDC050153]|uniref:RHS repeat-associated core domain-containing protein n=1 Tax=Nonomuraea sp. NPDC050153 TaxID=3364359 RepID=UPI0037B874DF